MYYPVRYSLLHCTFTSFEMAVQKPLLCYWGSRGIGQPIRFALEYLRVEYEEIRLPLDQSGLERWKAEKFSSDLDFPNLPYWKEDGFNITEARAILKYVAKEKGSGVLMPSSSDKQKTAEMLENVLWEAWQYLIRRCIYDTDELKSELETNAPQKFEQLDKFLRGNKWLLGQEISYLDFILYEILHDYGVYDSTLLKGMGRLLQLKNNFEELPAIKKYMSSSKYVKTPCFFPLFVKYQVV